MKFRFSCIFCVLMCYLPSAVPPADSIRVAISQDSLQTFLYFVSFTQFPAPIKMKRKKRIFQCIRLMWS